MPRPKLTGTKGAFKFDTPLGVRVAMNRWKKMHQRCYSPTDKHFADYGGRGIFVSNEWHDFQRFYADMGDPPTGMTLDRIDNDGPYSKENCRWATCKQQMSNRRSNVFVAVGGKMMTLRDAAAALGVSEFTLYQRVRRGASPQTAVMKPLRRNARTVGKLGTNVGGESTGDLGGTKIGRLTVVRFAGLAPNRVSLWVCKCECGSERTYRRSNLFPGKGKINTVSCGCHRREVQSTRMREVHRELRNLKPH